MSLVSQSSPGLRSPLIICTFQHTTSLRLILTAETRYFPSPDLRLESAFLPIFVLRYHHINPLNAHHDGGGSGGGGGGCGGGGGEVVEVVTG